MKMITIRTLDNSGDSTQQLALEEAVLKIIKEKFSRARFVYVGTQKFNFGAKSEKDAKALQEDVARLTTMLENAAEPTTVRLTGDLVGGN